MRDYDNAIKRFIKTLELQPGSPAAHEYFGDACAQKGMTHEAITQWAAAFRFSGQESLAQLLENQFASSGFDAALKALGEKQLEMLKEKNAAGRFFPAWDYVSACLRTRDYEQALDWLPRVVEEPTWFALQLKLNPVLDPIRSDPRFNAALAALPN